MKATDLICLAAIMVMAGLPLNRAMARSDRLDINIGLRSSYDDNVLNYSDADLDRMDDPRVNPDRYGIKSKDDYIIAPELELIYKTYLAGHSLHLGVNGSYHYYRENDVKRFARVEGFIRRYLKRGAYLQASVAYLPDYYYRNTFTDMAGFQEAKFDKIIAEFKLALTPIRKLQANFIYTYAHKNFTPLFDERDITAHDFAVEGIYRPGRLWKGWGSYAFTTARSAGADNPDYRRDTSYDAFEFVLGFRLYLHGLNSMGFEPAAWIEYEKVFFQTDKLTSADSYRLGRKDNRWELNLSVDHELGSGLRIGAGLKRIIKDVDLPATELKKYLEYNSNSAYVKLSVEL